MIERERQSSSFTAITSFNDENPFESISMPHSNCRQPNKHNRPLNICIFSCLYYNFFTIKNRWKFAAGKLFIFSVNLSKRILLKASLKCFLKKSHSKTQSQYTQSTKLVLYLNVFVCTYLLFLLACSLTHVVVGLCLCKKFQQT